MTSVTLLSKQSTTLTTHAFRLQSGEDQDGTTGKDGKEDGGGFFLRHVDVIDTSVGLYGRTVVSFGSCRVDSNGKDDGNSGKSSSRPMLDAHRLTVGDDIEILPKNGKGGSKTKRVGGVVCSVDDYIVSQLLLKIRNDNMQRERMDLKNREMTMMPTKILKCSAVMLHTHWYPDLAWKFIKRWCLHLTSWNDTGSIIQ